MSGRGITKYKKSSIKDNRNFIFGSIWKVRDLLINIPNIDRITRPRKYHTVRCVIVIDNSKENFNKDNTIISVAPISHRTDCKNIFDIDLYENKDGVLEDSILMLNYIQPMLKKDLFECVGKISIDKKYEIIDNFTTKIGISNDIVEQEIASGIVKNTDNKENSKDKGDK